MKSLWSESEAKEYESDLALRVYTSNLLGRSDELVLHGGGNTSVKLQVDGEEVLYVKGSGWDLVSIEEEGFAPVKLEALKKMAQHQVLSDTEMVKGQKEAMLNKDAPNPSVEAILHAIIPYKYVDHTHADAIVTISNSKEGETYIKNIFPNFLVVPYVMPGFILARKIYEMSFDIDWESCEGIILHNHGIFTFDNDAKVSYEKMIEAVSKAEYFLHGNAPLGLQKREPSETFDLEKLQKVISKEKGFEVSYTLNQSPLALEYVNQEHLTPFATRGVLTPEHIIRTKRVPLILENDDNIEEAVATYKTSYQHYFEKYAKAEVMLNPAPNYVIVKGVGVVSFGKNEKEARIVDDIVTHTMKAVLKADKLGGYKSISEAESFAMEYWELEQAKLKK
jgi:rhamnose utilization protein RhaD (predicted bifunctional aldolase and dehydrogenase)